MQKQDLCEGGCWWRSQSRKSGVHLGKPSTSDFPFRKPVHGAGKEMDIRAQPILTGYLEMQNRFPTKPGELVVVVEDVTPLS